MLRLWAQSHLDARERRLEQLRIPERAERLQAIAGDVRRQLRRERARKLWISERALADIDGQLEVLELFAPRLVGLAEAADRLKSRLETAAREAKELDGQDADLDDWFGELCESWFRECDRLGAKVDRTGPLESDRHVLRDLENKLDLHQRAIQKLAQAEQLRTELPALDTADLEPELQRLRRELFGIGPTEQWLEDISERLKPLEARRPKVEEIDPAERLREALLWSRMLGESQSEIEALIRERQNAGSVVSRTKRAESLRAVYEEAGRVLDHLLDKARNDRSQRLDGLRSRVRDLTRAAEPLEELEQRLSKLSESFEATKDWQHREWVAKHNEATSLFYSLAEARSVALRGQRDELLERIADRVQQFRGMALSLSMGQRLDDLDRERRRLAKAAEVDGILMALTRGRGIEQELSKLEGEIEEDRQRLLKRRLRIEARHEQLKSASERFGESSAPLILGLEVLDEGTLEERLVASEQVERQLDNLESSFIDRCRRSVAKKLERSRLIDAELMRLGVESGDLSCFEGDTPTSPEEASEQAVRAQSTLEASEARSESAQVDVRESHDLARQDLERVSEERLRPHDRKERRELLANLNEVRCLDELDSLDRLVRLREVQERSERFLDRVTGSERKTLKASRDLRSRLARLDRRHPNLLPGALIDRVAALVYGISLDAGSYDHETLDAQRATTDRLLSRLEAHASRLNAKEIAWQVALLRSRASSSSGEGLQPSAEALLEELDAYGDELELPEDLQARLERIVGDDATRQAS